MRSFPFHAYMRLSTSVHATMIMQNSYSHFLIYVLDLLIHARTLVYIMKQTLRISNCIIRTVNVREHEENIG